MPFAFCSSRNATDFTHDDCTNFDHSGRAVGETAVARPTGGGSGFWGGFNDVVFGKKELEIPEEVATDRAK